MKTAEFIQSINSHRDLTDMSTEELKKWEKRLRDVAAKRYKALDKKVQAGQKDKYATFSYDAMKKYIDDNGGLPKTDKSAVQPRSTLKTNIWQLKQFLEHETSTLTGAKYHAERLIRIAAVGPKDGPLTKKEQQAVAQYKQELQNNDELITEFWTLYHEFRVQNESNFKYDPEQTLELFTQFYQSSRNDVGGLDFTKLQESIHKKTQKAIADKNIADAGSDFESLLSGFKEEPYERP